MGYKITTSIEHLSWPNWTIKMILNHKNDLNDVTFEKNMNYETRVKV